MHKLGHRLEPSDLRRDRISAPHAVEHFRREEEILFPLYLRHAGSTPMLERSLRGHRELHGLLRALRVQAAAGDIPPEALRSRGDLLHDHVRVEGRELFAEIERLVPAAELERLRR